MRAKNPPERPLVIIKDTREPDLAANDHPDTVFRPSVYAANIPKGTPEAERPRVEVPTVRAKLDVGDYSLPGLETVVALERKSGPDLLATLFGSPGNDALGEQKHNIERFRAELERAYAARTSLAIVVEGSEEWLDAEACRRRARYGKSFEPDAVRALFLAFAIDLGVPTVWCPARWEWTMDGPGADCGRLTRGRILSSAKASAELYVGSTLARIWSQATGGEKARGARKRGYDQIPWLGALESTTSARPDPLHEGLVGLAPISDDEADARPVDMDKVVAAWAEMREEGARRKASAPAGLAPAGGARASSTGAEQDARRASRG